jgi:uncharacterized repeat protein (TIGR03803 family)
MPAALAAAVLCAAWANPALAGPQKILYSFTGGTDGGFPQGGVIADSAGNLYGTTTSDGVDHSGVVYELSPGAGPAKQKQTTLYAFTGGADGAIPQAGLVADAKGNLYGTTYSGGANSAGVVFELSPPAKGKTAWTEQTLWTFTGGNDGSTPAGALILDKAGNLYGTTTEGGTGVVGTVFELSPPQSGNNWTESVLYNFTGNNDGGEPYGRMLLASDGNLYGTSAGYGQYNYGTIFKLTAANGGKWTFSVLHAFEGSTDGEVPRDGLIQAPNGTLYGDTAGFDDSWGNVFSLQTDGSGYTVLWNVPGLKGYTGNGPWQTVSLDSSGNLYGATLADGKSASGEIFELTPPADGKKKWKATVLHKFQANAKGQIAYTTVLVGTDGVYGTTYGAAGQAGFYPGTIWRITP